MRATGRGKAARLLKCTALMLTCGMLLCPALAGCGRPGRTGTTARAPQGSAGMPSAGATLGALATASATASAGAGASVSAAATATVAPGATAVAPGGQSGTGSVKAGEITWLGLDRDVLTTGDDGVYAGQDGTKEAHLQLSLTALGQAKLARCELQYASEDFAYDFVQGNAALVWLDGRAVPAGGGADIASGAHTLDIFLYTLVGENGAPLPLVRGRLDIAVRVDGAGGEQVFRKTVNNPQ